MQEWPLDVTLDNVRLAAGRYMTLRIGHRTPFSLAAHRPRFMVGHLFQWSLDLQKMNNYTPINDSFKTTSTPS